MVYRRKIRGRGFFSFLGKARDWLKKTGLISKIGKTLGAVGVPYAGTIGSAAGALGYGRRRRRVRRRCGRGLHLPGGRRSAGGSLRLAGALR